jgi:hypothetical protein
MRRADVARVGGLLDGNSSRSVAQHVSNATAVLKKLETAVAFRKRLAT